MGKHFEWSFDEWTEAFTSTRKQESIAAEERLDGIYVIRTNLSAEALGRPRGGARLQEPGVGGAGLPAR